MSDRGRATVRIGDVTISEDGEGGFEWCVEEYDKLTYGRIDKDGRRHTESKRRPDSESSQPGNGRIHTAAYAVAARDRWA